MSYWRTASGSEVDFIVQFIVQRRGRLVAVEVKATPAPGPRDVAHLRRFLDDYGSQAQGGLLLHGGEQSFWLGDRVLAVPWWSVV